MARGLGDGGGEIEAKASMLLAKWLKPKPSRVAGQRLYAATVAAARTPALYQWLGAPDTPDGRFEIYTLHVLLVLARLRSHGEASREVAQTLFDVYLSDLDNGLRELAVGDLSVAKTMRKLGEAFYGRGRALDAALAELPNRAELEALVRRTVLGGATNVEAAPLADYLLAVRDRLASLSDETVRSGEIAWPQPG